MDETFNGNSFMFPLKLFSISRKNISAILFESFFIAE